MKILTEKHDEYHVRHTLFLHSLKTIIEEAGEQVTTKLQNLQQLYEAYTYI